MLGQHVTRGKRLGRGARLSPSSGWAGPAGAERGAAAGFERQARRGRERPSSPRARRMQQRGAATQAKVVLLGEGRVGKTSLVLRFCKEVFSEGQPPTVQASYLDKQLTIGDKRINLAIWDTAGQARPRPAPPPLRPVQRACCAASPRAGAARDRRGVTRRRSGSTRSVRSTTATPMRRSSSTTSPTSSPSRRSSRG